jgi:hypothetical protein
MRLNDYFSVGSDRLFFWRYCINRQQRMFLLVWLVHIKYSHISIKPLQTITRPAYRLGLINKILRQSYIINAVYHVYISCVIVLIYFCVVYDVSNIIHHHHHKPIISGSVGRSASMADASPHVVLHCSLLSTTRSNVETLSYIITHT